MKDYMNRFETLLASWYARLPHLKPTHQQWFAANIWWLILIGVILNAISIILVVLATFFFGAFATIFGGAVGTVVAGVTAVAVVFAMAFTIVVTVISAMAIAPLKARQRRGWYLLLVALVINLVWTVLGLLIYRDIINFFWNMLSLAVTGYLLFEIRTLYLNKSGATKRSAATTTNTK
jgi:hypothetical protein